MELLIKQKKKQTKKQNKKQKKCQASVVLLIAD